jgi:hypothetical protein
MNSAPTTRIEPACPSCAGTHFELRVHKDEGLAAARCLHCNRNYLLLDSQDYWFDVIQTGYPRASRCPCKGDAFKLNVEYCFRANGDVKWIAVSSQCAACGKARRLFTADIDYAGTEHLVSRPLTDCPNPKILYDLKQLNLYAASADMARVIDYLAGHHQLGFDACVREGDHWVVRPASADEAKQLVLYYDRQQRPTRYLWIYASTGQLTLPDPHAQTSRDEDVFWKHNEIIRISPPTHVRVDSHSTLLFYINFSGEYVDDDDKRVVAKSPQFRTTASRLIEWLGTQFVSWRGTDCYDNPDEHVRVFGDRFTKRKSRRKGPNH